MTSDDVSDVAPAAIDPVDPINPINRIAPWGNVDDVEPANQMTFVATTGRFERSDRLLESKDYRRVLRRGRRRASPQLVVITTKKRKNGNKINKLGDSLHTGSRLGITASRKVGNAVIRNRFKRRMREWFRQRRSEFGEDLDLVVIARRSGARLSLVELDRCLSQLMGLAPAFQGTK